MNDNNSDCDCSQTEMSDSLSGSKCYQAFNLMLALVFLTFGSLLTAVVVSHSTSPASSNIFYLGPSLLAVGGLVLALFISLLVMRLSKFNQHRKLERNQQTGLRVRSFPFSSPPQQQPGLERMKVPKIITATSSFSY